MSSSSAVRNLVKNQETISMSEANKGVRSLKADISKYKLIISYKYIKKPILTSNVICR